MMLLTEDIVKAKTGWEFAAGICISAVREIIEATGEVDFYLLPKDYLGLAFELKDYTNSGRTDENMPYFEWIGIRFVLISNEKYKKLKLLL